MSAENVELVMSMSVMSFEPNVDLVSLAGDPDASAQRLDAIRCAFDQSFRCTMRFPGLAPVTYAGGLAGLGDAWRDWLKHWSSYKVETEEVFDCGERVVVVHTARAKSRPSVPEATLKRATICTFRDDLIVHIDFNVPYGEVLPLLEPATAGDYGRSVAPSE